MSKQTVDANQLLSAIPEGLRSPLLAKFREIATNFAENRWEPSELNGGKFCECAYWICHGFVTGSYPAHPSKPPNMVRDCRALEGLKATSQQGDHSLRVLIPRTLPFLYDIRNNRGVGHVGGDVDPNFMDATAVYSTASWIMAELVRVFHSVTVTEAQEAVDSLVERKTPLVWSTGITKRVLATDLDARDQTLLLLHQAVGWYSEADLLTSIEYSSASKYRSRVLVNLHKDRMIEFDVLGKKVRISPKGSKYVEDHIIRPTFALSK